jgi:hypothetical protein
LRMLIPALLTRISTRPNVSTLAFTDNSMVTT